jgi:hypothetical protein
MLKLSNTVKIGGGGGNNCQSLVDAPPETQASAGHGVPCPYDRFTGDTASADVFKSFFLARTGDSDEMIWFRTVVLNGAI